LDRAGARAGGIAAGDAPGARWRATDSIKAWPAGLGDAQRLLCQNLFNLRPHRRGAFRDFPMNRKVLLVGSAALLGMAIFVGTFLYISGKAQPSSPSAERRQAGLVQFYSPTLGNPEAKVHIVEFLDPACEACASFYPHVKQIMAAYPDRVRLTVRLVPFHKGSDYVVKVLDAARKQGRFWQALEALLVSQSYWTRNHTVQPDLVWKPLEGVGLNIEQLKVDMSAPDVAQRIEQELKDARTLKVTQTPEYFVNGRPLPSFGLEQLQALVREEVQAAYR
jgi:protein-disulfide isomerase